MAWRYIRDRGGKGHPPSADLRYRKKDSNSHCTLMLAAIKGLIPDIYSLYPPQEASPEMKLK